METLHSLAPSSTIPALLTLSCEAGCCQQISEPDFRYGEDRVVVLPVNTTLFFYYWEFSDETYERMRRHHEKLSLYHVQTNVLLAIIEITAPVGSGYVTTYHEARKVYAIVESQTSPFHSRIVTLPRKTLSLQTTHTWMRRKSGQKSEIVSVKTDVVLPLFTEHFSLASSSYKGGTL